MIRLNTELIFAARGITNPYNFLVKAGFAPRMANQIMNKDGKIIKYAHLEKLCIILNCTPADVLEYLPSQNQTLPPNHPLLSFQKNPEEIKNISDAFKNMPLDKLKEISGFINTIENNKP